MRRFWSDRSGNIAVLFALAIVPIIGGMGAAVDYSLANSYRTDIQKALDATALSLTKILPADDATVERVGTEYFLANMGNHTLTDLDLSIVQENGFIRLHATGNYKPVVASVLGVGQFQVGANAEARWSLGKVEVALVLDNSLSMNDLGRMTQLKAATHDLLNVLENSAKEPGDAKVAIVPFDGNVKVTATPVNNTWITGATWLRWDLWDDENQTCTTNWSGKKKTTTCVPDAHTTWNGCVTDRNKDPNVNYDTNDTAPTSATTNFPAWQCYNSSLAPILPLTMNWGTVYSTDATTLHGKVNNMTPTGYTNINIGLVWGWHVLSPTQRHTEGAAYETENLSKYIVLMTDGNNTQSRYDSCPINGPCPSIDGRTSATCNAIKAVKKSDGTDAIKIYTIRLINGNATLLQNCATNTSMYYDVQNAGQLSSVFNSIGAEIASLHLSK
jgi:Flp pilus assembly protein TadG